MSISVLMSVYRNEKADFLAECLRSLATQSVPAAEVVLVEDGPIEADLQLVIDSFRSILPIRSLKLKENVGLAAALNAGLAMCSHALVARMDTDDIALPTRFERQIRFMNENPTISVCSSWVEEKDKTMARTLFEKRLPADHGSLLNFAKRRNPINHPASMFRAADVRAVGGYPLVFPEDYALWSLMLTRGYRFANLQETLIFMRTGDDFIDRRGFGFLRREVRLVQYQRKIGFFSLGEALMFMASRMLLRMAPPAIRKFLYLSAR